VFNAGTDNILFEKGQSQRSIKPFSNCYIEKLARSVDDQKFYALAYPSQDSFSTYILCSNKKVKSKTLLPLMYKEDVH